jgi:sugar fermentation stimulation protein A
MAVERDGVPVFLHTHDTNHVAQYLIENNRIAPLRGAKVTKKEVAVGRNRFDLLLRQRGKDIYLEVKSCTLFGNNVAMFPDAVTERGRRHLLELAEMGRHGMHTMILFMIHGPHVAWFMPDYHTDYAFSTAMLAARKNVGIIPVALGWRHDLTLDDHFKILKIPWQYLEKEVKDRGSYLLILRMDRHRKLHVGRLGKLSFNKGFYVYVGSAVKQLTTRINRHCRKEKQPHWHIDYMTSTADHVLPIPVRSSHRLECAIARAVSSITEPGPIGFGSSDCSCTTHLFWSPDNPLESSSFHQMLQHFRMRSPDSYPP